MAPTLVSELDSDPEHVSSRCLNNIPAHLRGNQLSRQDDLRTKLDSRNERSALAAKVMHFGGVDLKKEYRNRASETDLMRHLERERVPRDMVRRVVTGTANHLTKKDYNGIK